MKLLNTILLFSVLLLGCREETPNKIFKGKLLAYTCRPVVQITGADIGEKWRGYDNVVVINNLFPHRSLIPSDSIFYFKSYETLGFEYGNCGIGYFTGLLLELNINIYDFSPTPL